jgi:lysophospholipase L1-like esterase
MRRIAVPGAVFFGLLCLLLPPPARAAAAFELVDGDRVVLVGSTLIEREQRYGYWETALTGYYADRNITFRNLGWSGDTVWGEARASFDPPKEGYRRLVQQTLSLKPTVIVLGYGTNESFAGAAGLPRFRAQYNKLLDDLAPAKARFVLLAPLMFEEATWKGGDLAQCRQDLRLYTQAIKEIAAQRRAWFVDDVGAKYGPASPLTDNGMHLTAYGYWRTAGNILTELRLPVRGLRLVELDGLNPKQVRQEILPSLPVPPHEATADVLLSDRVRQWLKRNGVAGQDFASDSFVIARHLQPGRYTLQIDGRAVQTEDADIWIDPPAAGRVFVLRGPSLDQAERLRQAIVEKNRLYFNRWRPQNETYLFGFRKHEQGQNAREIPEFDPLVAKAETEIARLRVPVAHRYELVPEKK